MEYWERVFSVVDATFAENHTNEMNARGAEKWQRRGFCKKLEESACEEQNKIGG
jgi:Leu/Phe-tRNA-protein transferase